MITYLLLATLIILPTIFFKINKNQKTKKIYIIYSFTVLTILAAIRKYTIGIDLEIVYYPFFNLIKSLDNFSNLSNIGLELGFSYLMKLIAIMLNDYQFFIIITSIISFPVFGYFVYKNSEDVGLSSIIYLLSANYFMELNVVRQACAMSFIMISYEFYKKKKNIFALIFIILATSFHSSSLFFIIVPFIKNIKLTKMKVIILLFVSILLMIYLPQTIEFFSNLLYNIGLNSNKNYSLYLNNKMHGASYIGLFSISEVLISLGIFLIGFYCYKLKNKKVCECENYKNLLLFSFLYFLFNFLALRINVVRRMGLYFFPFAFCLLPNAIQLLDNKKNRVIMKMIFVILIGIRYVYMLFGLAESLFGVLPYKFFWN